MLKDLSSFLFSDGINALEKLKHTFKIEQLAYHRRIGFNAFDYGSLDLPIIIAVLNIRLHIGGTL